MKQDLDISNIESKPKSPKRDRIRIERKKYDELVAEVEQLKADNALLKILRDANKDYVAENDKLRKEGNRLKADIDKLKENESYQNKLIQQAVERSTEDAFTIEELRDDLRHVNKLIESKATEHAHLDSLARNLRDQRDMARFIAAMFLIVCAGFAAAVWVGKLVPNLNLD